MSKLTKQVRRARWRDSYKLVFGLVMLFGCAWGAYNLEGHVNPPPKLTSGYHGYMDGTTQFRHLEIKDGGKLALYPDGDLEYKMLSPEDFKRKIHITDGNTNIGDASRSCGDNCTTSIGDASSDTVTIYDDNVVITLPKGYKCQN